MYWKPSTIFQHRSCELCMGKRHFHFLQKHLVEITSECVCVKGSQSTSKKKHILFLSPSHSGTDWRVCLVSFSWRTSPVQRLIIAWLESSSSGRSMRSKWLPTLERAWGCTASLSLSTHCREVRQSSHTHRNKHKHNASSVGANPWCFKSLRFRSITPSFSLRYRYHKRSRVTMGTVKSISRLYCTDRPTERLFLRRVNLWTLGKQWP